MTEGPKVALANEAPVGSGRELVWALPPQAEQRRDRHLIDLHGAPRDRAALTRATSEARLALREAVFATAIAAARARSVAEALDQALADLADVRTTPVDERSPPDDCRYERLALSSREREVLALVAEGRSNKAIAEALFVSPNTIKTHVASLLNKLQAKSRVQLAAMVAGQESC